MRTTTMRSGLQVSLPSAAAILLATQGPAWAGPLPAGLFVAPATFSVSVEESLLPGGTVFEDSQVVDTGQPGATPSVELLHTTEHSSNFSGRSRQIQQGFASAQADNTGNGGVGVTNWLAITPGVDVTSQLAAKALWTQTFTNTGSTDIKLSLNLHIPDMEVGLIGVPPNRTGPSNTETALTQVDLAVAINRAGGTLEHGGDFTFGMKASEKQFPLGTGPNVTNFSNFAVLDPFSSGKLPINPFLTLKDNGDDSVPKFTIDKLSFTQTLGTLHPGDILSYVYTLTAEGTTHGAEQGYLAFLGDPFDFTASGGGFEVTAATVPQPASVPEPASWVLSMLGLILIVVNRRSAPSRPRGQREVPALP
jgi:hypothetical protein